MVYRHRYAAVLLTALLVLSPLHTHAEILRWDTGEVIPGTEGIEPGPSMELSEWNTEARNLRYANFVGGLDPLDLGQSNFSNSWLNQSRFRGSNLTGANLQGADLSGTDLVDTFFSNANLTGANLTGAVLSRASLAGANLTGANLTNTRLTETRFTDANLTGAIITRADFSEGGQGLTQEQFYSTQSYQDKDLMGINFSFVHLPGWNFAGQNLARAGFEVSNLTDVNFTGANLADAFLVGATLTGANLSFADMRAAVVDHNMNILEVSSLRNTILSNGIIRGLELNASELLMIRDDNGMSDPPPSPAWNPRDPIAITVEDHLTINDGGLLQLVLEDNPWGSRISFAAGISVQLGGTLELTFAAGADVATQVGNTFPIFDWTGVEPAGEFEVASPHATWDLANLYTTGEVTLLGSAVAGDVDFDGQLTASDIDALATAIRQGDSSNLFDLNHDGIVSLDDHQYWVEQLKQTWLGDANLDGVFNTRDLVNIFQAGEYEDTIVGNSSWSTGDWNGDGEFDSSDLVAALSDGGYLAGPRAGVAAVPEPNSVALMLLGTVLIGAFAPWRDLVSRAKAQRPTGMT